MYTIVRTLIGILLVTSSAYSQRVMQKSEFASPTERKEVREGRSISRSSSAFTNRAFRIGIRGGAGIADIGEFDFIGKQYLPGLQKDINIGLSIGVNFDYKLTDHLTLRAELNYVRKAGGYKYENPNVIVITSNGVDTKNSFVRYTFQYVEVPLLVKIPFSQNDTYAWVAGGFAPSFLTQANFNYNYWASSGGFGVSTANSKTVSNSVDNVNPVDVPLMIGMGVDIFKEAGFNLVIDGRYSHGLIPVFPNSTNYHSFFTVGLGLAF